MKKFLKYRKSLLLIIVLAVASFFRLYKIEAYLTFLGDEGRDALVALNILRGDFTLLGPRASAGDFFLGPIYYYMITPFLYVWNYNPVGPAIMVALIGIATVFLVFYVAKKFFGFYPALAAAALYAIAPLAVHYSRSSWNPNPMPFTSLLLLYFLYLGVKETSWKKLFFVGFLLGIALQLHYIATFLAVIVAVFVVAANIILKRTRLTEIRAMIFQYFQIFAGFLLGFSPFIAFEIRHGFPNTTTIFSFIFSNTLEKGYQGESASFFEVIADVAFRVFGRILTAFPTDMGLEKYSETQIHVWQVGTIILGILLFIFIFKIKDKLQKALLLTWLILGIVLFGFYKKNIYDYYFGFMFPLPFILLANFFHTSVSNFKKISKNLRIALISVVFLILFFANLINHPFKSAPNHQKDQMRKIAEFILEKTNGQPYNFALIAEGNTDHAYRYFLELHNRQPVTIENNISDPERKSATDQLFVVCEQECSPLGHELWEVAGFGRAEIESEWKILHTKIYKLVPYEEN